MANGQQIARENIDKLDNWLLERRISNDWFDYLRGNKLNRTEIAKECGFSASVLRQNPTVKMMLEDAEKSLKDKGLLKNRPVKSSVQAAEVRVVISNGRDRQRIKALEENSASLRAEIIELKASLKRYSLFEKHLSETGRIIKP